MGGGVCKICVEPKSPKQAVFNICIYIYVYIIYIYIQYVYIYILLNRNRQRRGRVHGFEPENAKRGGVFKIYVEEKAPNEGSC